MKQAVSFNLLIWILFYGDAVRHAQAVFTDFWESTLSVNATDIIGTCAEYHLKALREHYEQLHHEGQSLTEDKLYDAQSY